MSMHISAAPGEVAENVILPGDPLRARIYRGKVPGRRCPRE